jgi:hypothetical protein
MARFGISGVELPGSATAINTFSVSLREIPTNGVSHEHEEVMI